ncbi:MAG TPA: VWA domain-containing protein [Gammaproteobacteria bacterium]|nr:VWA domain-containing protein [Gammaproteobacteria bacterium]
MSMTELHFLRPWWLLALLLLPLLWRVWSRLGRQHSPWQRVCDAALLPHVLERPAGREERGWRRVELWVGLALLLAVLALAGPAWTKLPVPVARSTAALVIALDLSRSMDAADLPPSRLTRARFKIADILTARREGQTALLVYAARPFVVAPLTDDTETLMAQLPALTTDIMPAQGSRPDLALRKAGELLSQAGIAHGDILLVTDGVHADYVDATRKAISSLPHRISVLAVGTEDGAPIPLPGGGFVKDESGKIVVASVNHADLRALSAAGRGLYLKAGVDDGDTRAYTEFLRASAPIGTTARTDLNAPRWLDAGPWLLLPLLPLAALTFRRGLLLAVLFMLFLPLPRPAQAFEWDDLWWRQDQQAAHALAQGDNERAAAEFNDPRWRAAAHYRAHHYHDALRALTQPQGDDDHYNRGNALARLGQFENAIAEYEEALRLNPKNGDARYNRGLLQKKLRKQKQEEGGGNGNSSPRKPENKNEAGHGGGAETAPDKQNSPSAQAGSREQRPQSAPPDQSKKQEARADQADKQKEQQHAQGQTAEQSGDKPLPAPKSGHQQSETSMADEQWLRRIPDDPGGLLRRKFLLQYRQQSKSDTESQPW